MSTNVLADGSADVKPSQSEPGTGTTALCPPRAPRLANWNRRGIGPLHAAAICGHDAVLELLLADNRAKHNSQVARACGGIGGTDPRGHHHSKRSRSMQSALQSILVGFSRRLKPSSGFDPLASGVRRAALDV